MKALVTGADGLLGSNLVRELLEEGLSVRAFVQPGSPSQSLEDLPLEICTGDLLDDSNTLAKSIAGCDVVFHCAAITDLWADAELTWWVNFEGTRRILDASISADINRFIFVGSASSFQFGPLNSPGCEGGSLPDEYRGLPYMESKRKALEVVLKAVTERGLDAVVVMPTFLLGPHDFRPSSGELIRQFITRGFRFASPGGRNFVYAGDAAKAMAAALHRGEKGECYILGGANLSYFDFFSKVAKIAGVPPPRSVLPGFVILLAGLLGSISAKLTAKKAALNLTMARLSLLETYYSSAKAVKSLGMPQTPIEKAIEDSLQSLKDHGHL